MVIHVEQTIDIKLQNTSFQLQYHCEKTFNIQPTAAASFGNTPRLCFSRDPQRSAVWYTLGPARSPCSVKQSISPHSDVVHWIQRI